MSKAAIWQRELEELIIQFTDCMDLLSKPVSPDDAAVLQRMVILVANIANLRIEMVEPQDIVRNACILGVTERLTELLQETVNAAERLGRQQRKQPSA